MTSSSFTAHPESIRRLGGQFCTASQGLTGPASDFTGSALEVGEAFGLLGACDDAMEKYVSMAQSTQSSLEMLISVLQQGGEILQEQGTNYELVDNAVAEKAGQIQSGTAAEA
jgi:hypothetical protein